MPRASRVALSLLLLLSCLAASFAATLAPTVELRQVGELMIPFQAGLPIPTYEPQNRPKLELAEGWRRWRAPLDHGLSLSARLPAVVQALEKEGKGAHRSDFDDRAWENALLPSVANPPPDRETTGVWYRRRLGLPPTWQGKRVLLHCLAANYVADVWVNGQYVGYHEGGFTPFTFDITDRMLPGGANLISLRVDNPPWPTAGKRTNPWLLPERGDWWNATGVLRDLYLEAVPATSLVRADVRATPAEEGTRLRAVVVLRNAGAKPFSGRMTLTVYPTHVGEANLAQPSADAIALLSQPIEVLEGESAPEITLANQTVVAWPQELTLESLAPWSPRSPYLYVLEVTLKDGKGQLVDRLQTQFGVRTFAVDPKQPRLLLNNVPIFLAGVGRAEDDPQLGRVASYRGAQRVLLDLRSAKWLGANFLRLGRGVNHPVTTLLADRLGLVCWEDLPVAWLSADAMQEQWERRRIARQTLIEMLYQDMNRPSVCFWGIGYLLDPAAVHRDFVRDLADIARFLDGTRLMGETTALDDRSPVQTEGDVVGYALDAAVGADQDALAEAIAVLDRRRKAQPGKPIIITEFGALAGSDESAWDRQVAAAQDQMSLFTARRSIAGCAWWSLADYLTPAGIRATGLVTRDRRDTRPVSRVLADEFETFQARDAKRSE
jgi:beta-galactosidase